MALMRKENAELGSRAEVEVQGVGVSDVDLESVQVAYYRRQRRLAIVGNAILTLIVGSAFGGMLFYILNSGR